MIRQRTYRIIRDLHLYTGLFISPFVLVFSFSVFVLVHPRSSPPRVAAQADRTVRDLVIDADIENVAGRARIAAVRRMLYQCGVRGEIGFVQHIARQRRLVVPVSVPGRETVVTLDLSTRTALISERKTGLMDSLIMLHKSPGPHLADIRMNWLPLRIWRALADATVYLILFISASGLYLWAVLRSERRAGMILLATGVFSFVGIIYALVG